MTDEVKTSPASLPFGTLPKGEGKGGYAATERVNPFPTMQWRLRRASQ